MNDFLKEFAEEWKIDRDMPDCVEEGEWEQDHKYQYNTSIYKYKDRFVRVNQSRSGSYHSDWHYDDPTFDEVTKRVEMVETTYWDGVK